MTADHELSHTTVPDRRAVLERVAATASAQASEENFPVALRVLPRDPRDKLMRAYSFARFVDDVGDEAPGDRLALLDAVEADLRAVASASGATVAAASGATGAAGAETGSALLPVVDALRPLLSAGVPIEVFLDLIEANRMDQRVTRYRHFADLLHYCDYSAAPVGRIVLHIADAASEANIVDSDSVCNALQVLEHCQDVGEDARAGRVYLPGIELDDARAAVTGDAVRTAVSTHVALARGMLQSGRPLVRRLSGWPRLAVAGFVGGGLATAAALERADYDVLARAVRPSQVRTAGAAARLWFGRI